jgi:hypothetical protein
MHFVPRGVPDADPEVGVFLAGVSDRDYMSGVEVLGSFDPVRGDVFAAERLGFDLRDAHVVPFFQKIGMSLSGSQLRDPDLPHDAHRSLLEDARYTRTVDAIDYSIGHALLHNVPVRYADLSSGQLEEVLAQQNMRDLAGARKLPEFAALRNAGILSRMSDIAVGMVAGRELADAPNVPVLSTLHGIELAAPLSRLLHAHGVAPRVSRHTDAYGVSALGRFVYNRLHPSASAKHHQAELDRLRSISREQAIAKKAADEAALAILKARRRTEKASLE